MERTDVQAAIRQALESTSGALVVGDPGVGKTTLAAAVAGAVAEASHERSMLWLPTPATALATPWTALDPLLGGEDGSAADVDEVGRLISRCRRALAGLGDRPLLVVDDAHLVDDVTGVVLAELAHAGAAQVVATCRRHPGTPEAFRALVRQNVIEQVDVSGLSYEQVEALLDAALGGPVARETTRQAWEMTGGNPLYVRELVRSLRDADALIEVNGAWVWRDQAVIGRGLTDLIQTELSTLGPAERDVVDLLALAGPTSMDELAGTSVGDVALTNTTERGLVVMESHHRDGITRARLVHPVHAEVIRTTLPPGRRSVLYEQLSAARQGVAHPAALFSTVDWALSCGVTPAVEDLIAATRAAAKVTDFRLTSRLSGAALAQLEPDDPRALDVRLVRAQAARFAADAATARQDLQMVADHLPAGPDGEALRWRHARVTADLHQFVDDDTEAALTTIDGTSLTDPRLQAAREVDRLVRLGWGGEFGRGLPALEEFVEQHRGSRWATPLLGVLIMGLGQSGRLVEALAVADDAFGSWSADPRRSPWLLTELVGARFMTAMWLGDPERGMQVPHVEDHMARHDDAVVQVGNGRYHAARGEWTTAVAHFRGALSRFALRDPFGFGPTASANLAYALAALGDLGGARRAREDYESTRTRASRAVRSDSEMKLLAVSVALGEAETTARCDRLDEWSTREGLWLPAMHARHLRCVAAAAREDEVETAPLAEAAAHVDGPVPPLLLEHAGALADADPVLAGRLAGRLLEHGVWVPERPTGDLTPRQQEIAMLVRAGLSNREIAGRLVLSVRTVDTHVRHVFERLGVNTRADLATALARSGSR